MRILILHNRYQQAGGEDAVVRDELALLQGAGHDVRVFERSNDALREMSRVTGAVQSVWSTRSAAALQELLTGWRPDVAHVHNTFYVLSASVLDVLHDAGIPTVQTLHNFRPLCLQATFHRAGQTCEDCLGHSLWRGVARGCAQGSRAASAVLAAGLTLQRWRGSPWRQVQRFIVLSAFSRDKYVQAGWPAARLRVKPNFAPRPSCPADATVPSGALFVGRLSRDKGVGVLQEMLRCAPELRLRVVGDGPDAGALSGPSVEHWGWCAPERVQQALAQAAVVLIPSQTYEQFPRILAEAAAMGVPVVASDLGPMRGLIEEAGWGQVLPPQDAAAWAHAVQGLLADAPARQRMRAAARAAYEAHYSPEAALQALLQIYREAIASRQT